MTATPTLPPPPPPPPPPATEGQPSGPPTFMEQWLEKERARRPPRTKREYNEYFANQCLFPRHIPSSAMCDVEPMLRLIANHAEESDGGGAGGDPPTNAPRDDDAIPERGTALDDVRKIASLCATYKHTAAVNRDEYRHKRAVLLREKERRERAADAAGDGVDSPGTPQSAAPPPSPPPYHEEFTPLRLPENFLLSKIHAANYNVCLAAAACPDRTRRLLSCWEASDPKWVQAMKHADMGEYICSEERGAVERCVGSAVERVMKDVLG